MKRGHHWRQGNPTSRGFHMHGGCVEPCVSYKCACDDEGPTEGGSDRYCFARLGPVRGPFGVNKKAKGAQG